MGGKPLVPMIEECITGALLTTILVSTDSLEIMEIAQQWGSRGSFRLGISRDDTTSL
jgi:CMP-N-acetylneuraminic acid synthetase